MSRIEQDADYFDLLHAAAFVVAWGRGDGSSSSAACTSLVGLPTYVAAQEAKVARRWTDDFFTTSLFSSSLLVGWTRQGRQQQPGGDKITICSYSSFTTTF